MHILKSSTLILAALALTACTVNPYTGEKETSKAVKYGAAAAVTCGIIGSNKNRETAGKAALGCGAIGAGVGAYMDYQEALLRQELEGSGVRVQRIGDQIKLVMPGNVTFATDSADISDGFYSTLNAVSKVLAKYVDTTLIVSGHTDSTGKDDYNRDLSKRRAQSVASYLRAQGVTASRLSSRGYGSAMPVASNQNESGRAQNRRVELDLVPRNG